MLFVTCFYDLKSKEPEIKRRDADFYLEKGSETLKTNIDLVIFTEGKYTEKIQNLRNSFFPDQSPMTLIIDYPYENLPWYKEKDKLSEAYNKGMLVNANTSKDTVNYIILMRSKFFFIEESKKYIKNHSHICWVDFGVSYVAKNFHMITEFKRVDKIKIQCLRPTYQHEMSLEFFKYIQGRRAGGIIQIPLNLIDKFVSLCNQVAWNFHRLGYIPLEDACITYISVMNPELFEYYYGDYESVVENFNNDYHRGKFNILHLGITSSMCGTREFKDLQLLCKRTLDIRSFGTSEDEFIRKFISL